MNCSHLKAAAVAVVVAVLAATASAALYVSAAPLPAVLLSFPPSLWIAANVIVIWLVSSYRHHKTAASSSLAGHADDVYAAMNSLCPSSEHDLFAAAVAPDAAVVAPVSRRQPREARTAKRADRPRVRKKSGGEEKPSAIAAEAKPDGKKLGEEEKARTVVAEANPHRKKTGEEKPRAVAAEAKPDDIDVSMDSMWQAILQRGAARPVAVRKSETWSSDELPRMERAAEKAVARREMRKSATMVPPSPPHPAAAAPAAAKQGWRTGDVMVMAHDELLRRAESLIRRHHEHPRLQRQESDQRQAMEHQRRRPSGSIAIFVDYAGCPHQPLRISN